MRTSGYGSLRVGLRHSFSENEQVEGGRVILAYVTRARGVGACDLVAHDHCPSEMHWLCRDGCT